MKYIVVSPVRNEEQYISFTINSMLAQTIRPASWIIVNDGSSDHTRHIVELAASAHSWIKVVNRPDRGARKAGGGVVEAFYDGYQMIKEPSWAYLAKLDGDLSFSNTYFEECFTEFTGMRDWESRVALSALYLGALLNPNTRTIRAFMYAVPLKYIARLAGRNWTA